LWRRELPVCHFANPADKLFEMVNLCAEKLFQDLLKKKIQTQKTNNFRLVEKRASGLELTSEYSGESLDQPA
jgi:hypothetical protein